MSRLLVTECTLLFCHFSEHKTWFVPKTANVASYNNQVMATTRTADINNSNSESDSGYLTGTNNRNNILQQFNAVRINIDEIERQQLISIFKNSLKEKFLVFELDIQFLIIKVIMALVDINKIFTDSNNQPNILNRFFSKNRQTYFHVQVTLEK